MDFLVLHHVAILLTAFFFSYYLVPFFTQAAFRLGVMDIPDGTIKNHKTPVPYMGGIAIYLAFLGTIGLLYPIEERVMWLLVGSTMLMFVGFIDDLKRIKPSRKLVGQFLGVACLLHGGFVIKQTFFASAMNLFLSGFWMLSLINAVNLIDVMDGLATTVAIIAAAGFCAVALIGGQYGVSLLLLAFIGALLGFLWYNKPPAKIYMGDAGSLFIGGFLAAVPLLIKWSALRPDASYVALVIPAIPLMEVFCLVVIRTYKKIPFYRGSPHHFSIYLQNKGWSREKILGFSTFMGFYLITSSMAFLMQLIDLQGFIVLGVLFWGFWYAAVFSSLYVYPGSKVALSFKAAQLSKASVPQGNKEAPFESVI
ncbi:undecaprenyl/decaprenyl-phosphate alpha-N-acetylglucosaminyl 1-phosphate transferase [Candidatus Dependentiae bacterium]|nr:undecaprenyl/decaprenyl-phosphate alpha-N-acetylglucosaminyl 1-phosphate transferase [Candidatus Dependentiae bacterium]